MYEAYWGLTESPFRNAVDERWFVQSPSHEEALARLDFLVEQQRRCGVLIGSAGTGKSLLLQVLQRQVARTQTEHAHIDLLGTTADAMLRQVAESFGLVPREVATASKMWRAVEDHLHGLQAAGVQTVLLFDHFERAGGDCVPVLTKLLHVDSHASGTLTVVVASRPEGVTRSAPLVTELADLRIEIAPLSVEETGWYVSLLLERAGGRGDIFDASTVELLHAQTGGVPRQVNRLCDLALLAAMGQGLRHVDRDVVESAADELRPRMSLGKPPATLKPPATHHSPLPVRTA